MARTFIREKKNGFYVMTYRGPVSGPYRSYRMARSSTSGTSSKRRRSIRGLRGGAECACGSEPIVAGDASRSIGPFRGRSMQNVEHRAYEENRIRRELAMGSVGAQTDRLKAKRLAILNAESMAKYGKPYYMLKPVEKRYFATNTGLVKEYEMYGGK